MPTSSLLGKPLELDALEWERINSEGKINYDFHIKVEDLISNQLES